MDILRQMEEYKEKKQISKNTIEDSSQMEEEKCPLCKGMGFELYITEDGYRMARDCRNGCRQKMVEKNRLSFANLPEAFKDNRIQNFSTTIYQRDESKEQIRNAIKAVDYWLSNFDMFDEKGLGLYLYSHTKGSGKTRMIATVANELLDRKAQVKFATSLQILNEIKSSWNKDGASENKLLHQLQTTRILIIDDFGMEQTKDWITEKFYEIINGRYNERRTTLFTSNYSLDELRTDDRITNRIKERTFSIPFPEESVREIISNSNNMNFIQGAMGSKRQ